MNSLGEGGEVAAAAQAVLLQPPQQGGGHRPAGLAAGGGEQDAAGVGLVQQLVQQVGADLVHPLDILQHQQQGALLRRQRQDHQHAVEGHDAVDEHVGLFLHAALSAAEHGEQGADGLAIGGGDGDVLLADVAGDGQHHRLPGVEILLLLGLKAGGGDDLGVGHGPVGQKVGQQVGLAHPGLPQQDEGLPPPPGAGAGEELEQALQLLLPAHQKVVAALVLRVGPGVPLLHGRKRHRPAIVFKRGKSERKNAKPGSESDEARWRG